ncbi:MAG: DUF721 domain-containing protein [Betaproteobacteria bacterium]|nr:MAG: DUF721 domain-containing protein [Betaproteobacteria bacterium]
MPARKLSEILGDTRELTSLAASAHQLAQLQRIYLEAVPPELSKSSHVSLARAGVVTVVAGNGAVASKLRQVIPRVIDRFHQRGFEFNSMRIEVQVAPASLSRPARSPKRLSANAISAIEAALAKTPESPLKAALKRLARRR